MDEKSGSTHSAPLQHIELSPANLDTIAGLAWALDCARDEFRLFLLRCDYTTLRGAAIAALQDACQAPLQTVRLAPHETRLFSVLAERFELGDLERRPAGILVTGIEELRDRDGFLATLNQMREAFRARCPLPIVLLVEADLVARFQRQAKDFETWASIDVLEVEPRTLEAWLTGQRDRLFAALIDIGAPPIEQPLLDIFELPDVASALRDLQKQRPQRAIEPDVLAFYDFLRGRDAYERDRLEDAIELYQRSQERRPAPESDHVGAIAPATDPEIFRKAAPDGDAATSPQPSGGDNDLANLYALAEVVTLHIALCHYRRTVVLNRAGDDLDIARDLLLGALERCAQHRAWAIVSRFVGVLGEALRDLGEWETLRRVLARAIALHRKNAPQELPRDFSLRADLSLADGEPRRALVWLDRAEALLAALLATPNGQVRPLTLRLTELRARCWLALDRPQAAISLLERQRDEPCPEHPQLYIAILERLRSLYFHRQQYWQAFQVRCDRQAFEHERGLKAFIGAARLRSRVSIVGKDGALSCLLPTIAPEILASGRQQDIQKLVERIARKDLKVTVIYGFSGVGKSSLIHAGLIPTLRDRTLETQTVVPIALQLYDNWWDVLYSQLSVADPPPDGNFRDTCAQILKRLRREDAANRRPVLIFDQFEEFFFHYRRKAHRNRLFQFLGRCLEIPSLRVVFSIRRTYLHFLLNRPGLDCIDNDILSKRVLYRIGNFSADATRAILQQLTERASFDLEPELVDVLIGDLEAGYGKVRPIELQIVGAQLQQDGVTTLAAYQRTGGKTALVQRYLDRAIDDCGAEHRLLAELVLYLLAEKPNNRPIKTRSELEKEVELFASRGQLDELADELAIDLQLEAVQASASDLGSSPRTRDRAEELAADLAMPTPMRSRTEAVGLILKIFVGSGLAFQIPADLEFRYQLAHDYLAELVRQHYGARFGTPLEALQREKNLRSSTERELRDTLQQLEAALRRETQARHAAEVAQIEAAVRSSQILLAFDDRREALRAALDAGRRLQAVDVPPALRFVVLDALRCAVYGARQLDRLRGHDGWIDSIAIAPDGQPVASGASDGTVRLWFPGDDRDSAVLKPDCDWVEAVAFSPDGRWLVAAGDRSVFLWRIDVFLRQTKRASLPLAPVLTIDDRADWVGSITFSPDGQTLAIGCHDGTLDVVTLQASGDLSGSSDMSFLDKSSTNFDSAIGSLCAIGGDRVVAGTLDGRVLLWDFARNVRQDLGEHDDEIVGLARGRSFVWAGSRDGAIYRWPLDGSGLGNPDRARYRQGERLASFAVDRVSQRVAAGDSSGTVRVWDARGRDLERFTPHRDAVRALCFSPSGKTIASGSDDRTLSLWQSAPHQPGTLSQHDRWIVCVALSPDGRYGLSADGSGEVAIWTASGSPTGDATLHRWQGFDRPIRSAVLREISERNVRQRSLPNWEVAAIDRVGITRTWSLDGQPKTTIAPPIEAELAWTGIASRDTIYASTDGRVWLADRDGEIWLSLRCQQGIGGRSTSAASPNDSGESGLDICNICISRDRRQLAIGHRTGTVEIWAIDPVSGTAAFLYPIVTHTRAIGCLAFSPDDRLLAIGDYDRGLSVWTLATRQSHLCKGHAAAVNTVTFAHDGRVLVSGSYDRTIRFWDSATGALLHTVTDANSSLEALCCLPDRCALVSGSRDRRVRLWNFDLPDLLARGDALTSSPASL